jgi:hypothetical protein
MMTPLEIQKFICALKNANDSELSRALAELHVDRLEHIALEIQSALYFLSNP